MDKRLVRGYGVGHTRLQPKEVTMQRDRLLNAAILVTRIRDASPRSHALRLRYAKKLSDIVNEFIADEARTANSEPKNDQAHMSWNQIGQVLEISKNAAFTRYGGKQNEQLRGK